MPLTWQMRCGNIYNTENKREVERLLSALKSDTVFTPFTVSVFYRESSESAGEKMPKRPNIPCKHPGCPKLVAYGNKYCDEHKALHTDEVRSAFTRGYNRQWQKASKAFLNSHPLCEKCKAKGRYTKATVVDHIIPHRGNMDLFWDTDNWQSLCKSCHDRKTMTEDRYTEYKY